MTASRWDLIRLPRTTAGTARGISSMAVLTSNVKRRKTTGEGVT